MRRGRVSALGSGYSLTAIVTGSMLATRLAPNSTRKSVLVELTTIPYGSERGCGIVISLMSPVSGFSRPTMLACWSVKNRMPFWSKMGVWGSRAAGSGIGYSVMAPVLGSSFPTSPFELPVYQMLPDLSTVSPCGPDAAVFSGNSFIAPVLGSSRPSTFAHMPVHQMLPSGVASGSWGREPSVGATHSLIDTEALPGIKTAFGRGISGKFFARYSPIVARSAGGTSTMLVKSFSQSSRVPPPEFTTRLMAWHFVQVVWTSSFPVPSGSAGGGPPRCVTTGIAESATKAVVATAGTSDLKDMIPPGFGNDTPHAVLRTFDSLSAA